MPAAEPGRRGMRRSRCGSSRVTRSSRPTSAYRRVPVHEVRFASSTPAFDRPVEISGSNDRQRVLPRRRRPDLPLRQRRRDDRAARQPLPVSAHPDRERGRPAARKTCASRCARTATTSLLAPGFAPPYRVLYGGPAVPPEYDFAEQPEVAGRAGVRHARARTLERGVRGSAGHALASPSSIRR